MALNAEGVDWALQFFQTMEVGKTMSVEHMLGHSANMAKGVTGKKMFALAINCHGEGVTPVRYGIKECRFGFRLLIGNEGLSIDNARVFEKVKGCFERIYLVSCGAAAVTVPGGAPADTKFAGMGDGRMFCTAVADAAGTPVWAPEELQWFEHKPLPYGEIQLQGKVLVFEANRRDPKVETYDRHHQEYLRK